MPSAGQDVITLGGIYQVVTALRPRQNIICNINAHMFFY